MIRNSSNTNPLADILNSIPKEPIEVYKKDLGALSNLFKEGGIFFESYEEVVGALEVLDELELIELKKTLLGTLIIKRIIDVI